MFWTSRSNENGVPATAVGLALVGDTVFKALTSAEFEAGVEVTVTVAVLLLLGLRVSIAPIPVVTTTRFVSVLTDTPGVFVVCVVKTISGESVRPSVY